MNVMVLLSLMSLCRRVIGIKSRSKDECCDVVIQMREWNVAPTSVRLTAAVLLRPCMKEVEQDSKVGLRHSSRATGRRERPTVHNATDN
jgi:hypothetical protein